MSYKNKDKTPDKIMGIKCISLDEVPTFELYASRIGNSPIKAASNLEFAVNTSSVSIPEESIAYIYPTSQGLYEAAFGPEQKENNNGNINQIIHGEELRRYIAGLPGENLQEKFRHIKENERQGKISSRAARSMIDTIRKYGRTCDNKDKSSQGSLL